MNEAVYVFDQYRLDVRERRLWKGDDLVPLREKVFDTLVLLIEGAGRLRTQDELTTALWPDVAVEPNNLQHNISVLRRALAGSSVEIETLRGRGYRLNAEVSLEGGHSTATDDEPTPAQHEIRFCHAEDGAHLAWSALGDGPPIVRAANWCTHLELDCTSLIWRHTMALLGSHRSLIRYDSRGT